MRMIVDSNDLPSKLDARILPQLVCVLLLCVANALAVGPSSDQHLPILPLGHNVTCQGQALQPVQGDIYMLAAPRGQLQSYPRVLFPGSRGPGLNSSTIDLRTLEPSRTVYGPAKSYPRVLFPGSRGPVRSYPRMLFSVYGPAKSYPRMLFSESVQSSSVATRSQALMQGSILSPNNGSAAFLPLVEKPTPLLLPPSLTQIPNNSNRGTLRVLPGRESQPSAIQGKIRTLLHNQVPKH